MNIKPFHFLHPDFEKIKDHDSFFDQVRNVFPDLKKEGIYQDDLHKSIFVYRIKAKNRTYQGIIAAVDIHDYLKGLIKKHENTLTTQEETISNLMKERAAIIKPVLIAYNEQKKIKELIKRSVVGVKPKFKLGFERDQQVHEFFEITDKKFILQFQKEFKSKVKKAYIADGHHRMAAVCKFILQNPELSQTGLNCVMCALFDFSELSIFPYNRIIKAFDVITKDELFNLLNRYATITVLKKIRPSKSKTEMIIITADSCYSLIWRKEVLQYFKQKNGIAFDIDIFNEIILRDILGVQSIRSSDRITYLEGIKSFKPIIKAVQEKPDSVGFLFFPVRKSDFVKVADEHMVLPPKSTWFEPRIKNGIIVQDVDLQLK